MSKPIFITWVIDEIKQLTRTMSEVITDISLITTPGPWSSWHQSTISPVSPQSISSYQASCNESELLWITDIMIHLWHSKMKSPALPCTLLPEVDHVKHGLPGSSSGLVTTSEVPLPPFFLRHLVSWEILTIEFFPTYEAPLRNMGLIVHIKFLFWTGWPVAEWPKEVLCLRSIFLPKEVYF